MWWPVHLSHKPFYFSIAHCLHHELSGASVCYHTPGNQRYSHMSQMGVSSLQWGGGWVEGKWKLTYQKGHSCDTSPPLPLPPPPLPQSSAVFLHLPGPCWLSPFSFTGQQYLTNNTNVIPLPSSFCHNPSWFNGPVSCQYSLFNAF